jgi:hypothetical protein
VDYSSIPTFQAKRLKNNMKESQGTRSTPEGSHAAGNTELFESLSQEKKRWNCCTA